jgi:aryl-alcohol dehydrogenase-like predicted oxidoreductase
VRVKNVGREKTSVSAIGIGCMGVGGLFSVDTSEDTKSVETLRYAFDLGLTVVDTAEGYAAGHSEELVGKAIAGRRSEIYVATKVSPEHLSSRDLVFSAEESLKRLGTERIDLFQVHWPNPKIPLEQTMRALDSLVRSGRIRHIGLCNFSLKNLQDAEGYLQRGSVAAAQVEYNLFDRSIEKEYLPYCVRRGIAVIAYSPLDQGQICGGPQTRSLLEPIARRAGCSLGQLALAWVIGHPGVLAIPKASSADHLLLNAAAGEMTLSRDDVAEIDLLTGRNLREVPVDRIQAVPDDAGQRKVYRTVEEARANEYGFVPSPLELAAEMRKGEFLKAVRVRPSTDPTSGCEYELIEGRIRYWAWVIAFEGKRDIPVLVRT